MTVGADAEQTAQAPHRKPFTCVRGRVLEPRVNNGLRGYALEREASFVLSDFLSNTGLGPKC